jgi:hypothetical protein
MSKFKKVFKSVSSVLGLSPPKAPPLPKVQIPATPAPSRRVDTGATIVVGSDAGKNKRVSGRGSGSSSRGGGDILGGLGRGGGLNI